MTPPTEDRFSAFGSRVPQSDDLFRLAFEHAPIAKVLVGLDGRCHLVNPAMCAFTGFTEHELIGMPMARLSHPEDPDDGLIATDQVYTVGAIDKRYRTATGTIVWGAQSVTLVRGASGLPMHFIVQIQDITTRKQQEQELVEERRRLRDAESTGMIGSWERNLDTGTITWSNGMFELFGPDPEGSGRDLYAAREQIYPEDRATLDTAVQACVTTGDPIRVRYRVTRTDGATRWFDVRGEARYQNGRRNRICGTVIDVTDQVAAQSEAAAAYAMQQAVIKASPDIIELWDVRSGSGRWSNRPVGETLGYSAQEIAHLAHQLVHPEDRPAFDGAMAAARSAADDKVIHLDYRMHAKDGSTRWFSQRTAPLQRDAEGRVTQIVRVIRDTTESKAVEAALQESEARFRQLADNVNVGFVLRNLDPPEFLYVSPGYVKIFGYDPLDAGEDPDSTLRRVVHPEDWEAAQTYWSKAGAGQAATVELRIVRPSGEVRWIRGSTVPVVDNDGIVRRTASSGEDITQRKLAEEALLHQSLHDPLTGLPNRSLLSDRLEDALDAIGRAQLSVGVLFIDIDGFKQVNDSSGHAAGDELLIQVAARLRTSVRPGDTVARLGGDEFAIVCTDLPGLASLRDIAERVVATCSVPFELGGSTHRIGASVGLQLVNRPINPDRVLSGADAAMYRAKSAGGNQIATAEADL